MIWKMALSTFDEKYSEISTSAARYYKKDIFLAALEYEHAAKCFDSKGDRITSAQNFMRAGDCFLEVEKHKQASENYGKAAIRLVMSGHTHLAQELVQNSKSREMSSFQLRMAEDGLIQITDEIEEPEPVTVVVEETPEAELVEIQVEVAKPPVGTKGPTRCPICKKFAKNEIIKQQGMCNRCKNRGKTFE